MIVYFVNKTESVITLELGENRIELKNNKKINVDSETNQLFFHCILNGSSDIKHLPLIKSVIVSYNFILNSSFDISVNKEFTEIKLIKKKIKGSLLKRMST